MKKTLLLLIFPLLFSASYVEAQTKVWDFGNNLGGFWPLSAGIGSTEIIVDNLGLFPIATNTNFGAITASSATFSDGYVGANRFQLNGGGGGTAGNLLPSQRYVYFTVDGACTVKVWFKTGSNGNARTVLVTNGTTLLGSGTSGTVAGPNDLVIITANVSAANAAVGKIYIYGDTTSSNLYKIEVTGANVLANNDFQHEASVNVFSNGKLVNLANVVSETQVNVYNMTGALVKSFSTSTDMNFDLNSGFYIVNVKSAEGQKSVKVLIK
ncbi:MAG: hypothetical protein RL308_3381 [Bacteroidota bacterium]|jgi:hypothetical protein